MGEDAARGTYLPWGRTTRAALVQMRVGPAPRSPPPRAWDSGPTRGSGRNLLQQLPSPSPKPDVIGEGTVFRTLDAGQQRKVTSGEWKQTRERLAVLARVLMGLPGPGPRETRAPGVGRERRREHGMEEDCGRAWSLHLSAGHCARVDSFQGPGGDHCPEDRSEQPWAPTQRGRGEAPVPTSQRGGLVVRRSLGNLRRVSPHHGELP